MSDKFLEALSYLLGAATVCAVVLMIIAVAVHML